MNITIIAAYSENKVIGYENKLPWSITEDLQRFKAKTLNHTVIMGRKTYESILQRLRKPLPQRRNIVLTHNLDFQDDRILIAHSLEQALQLCDIDKENYVIGGEKIFELFLSVSQKMELTLVNGRYQGDAFFPEVNWNKWNETTREEKDTHSYVTFVRK